MKAVVLVAMAVAGCTTMDRASNGDVAGDTCNAAAVQDLVGKPVGTSEADAKRRTGAAVVRSYVTGAALTMDYRADRLNIETDAAGTILKLSCG